MSPEVSSIIIALIAGLTGSGGCSIILYLLQRRDKKKDGQTEEDKQRDEATKRQSAMLLGLGHDRIVYLGSCYVERGYITQDEYENLHSGHTGAARRPCSTTRRRPARPSAT